MTQFPHSSSPNRFLGSCLHESRGEYLLLPAGWQLYHFIKKRNNLHPPQNNPYYANILSKFIIHSKKTIYGLHAKYQSNRIINKHFTPLYSCVIPKTANLDVWYKTQFCNISAISAPIDLILFAVGQV